MAEDQRQPKFMDPESALDDAFNGMGKDIKLQETEQPQRTENIEAVVTVNDLLRQMKIDDFEKTYIQTVIKENYEIQDDEALSRETEGEITTLAEQQLSEMDGDQELSQDVQSKVKVNYNYYVFSKTVGEAENQRDIKIIRDAEGYKLFTIMDDQTIYPSIELTRAVSAYLETNYSNALNSGEIKVHEIVDNITPDTMHELYNTLGTSDFSLRMVRDRVDEYAKSKEIAQDEPEETIEEATQDEERTITPPTERDETEHGGKDVSDLQQEEYINQEEQTQPEGELEQTEPGEAEVDEEEIDEAEVEEESKGESLREKVAKIFHVNPAVVNIRVIDDLDRVKEDAGIHLEPQYRSGEVMAVRIPYKLGYRTFLAETATGMPIDQKGILETKPTRVNDVNEFEDYFRFSLRDGHDGGDGGKALRYEESRDYMTSIDEDGDVKEVKFKNNGEREDMLREEREWYILEARKADQELADAISAYEKSQSRDDWTRVQKAMQARIQVDKKYNALENQRAITEKTKENIEDRFHVNDMQSEIPGIESERDDDDWGPWSSHMR